MGTIQNAGVPPDPQHLLLVGWHCAEHFLSIWPSLPRCDGWAKQGSETSGACWRLPGTRVLRAPDLALSPVGSLGPAGRASRQSHIRAHVGMRHIHTNF